MTDKENLQKLFEAALKEPAPTSGGSPKRAFPEALNSPAFAPVAASVSKTAPAVSQAAVFSQPAHAADIEEPMTETGLPEVPVLDDAASTELGILLDEQIARQAGKRRRDSLVAALVFLGLTGGSFGWFVQSAERVEAFKSAIAELRSVTDVKGIAANYQAALDRIAARSQQIDQTSGALGVDPSMIDEKDPGFDAEMKEMMGGGGKAVGDRNSTLQKAFGTGSGKASGAPSSLE